MTDQPTDPLTEERDAIARIALSHDGLLLHRYLRRVLETVIEVDDPGALQRHTGRRTLARDLMRLMAEGIESAGRSHTSDQPVLVRAGSPIDARPGRRGGQRRVELRPGDGWTDEPDAGASTA